MFPFSSQACWAARFSSRLCLSSLMSPAFNWLPFKMSLQVSLLHCLNSLFLPLLCPNSLLSLLHWLHWLQSTVGYSPHACMSGPHFSNVVQPWKRGFVMLCVKGRTQRGLLHSPLMLYFFQTCWKECQLWSSHNMFFSPLISCVKKVSEQAWQL